MPAATLMPPVSNNISSSYAEIISAPSKPHESIGTTLAMMDGPTDTSGREDSSITPENNNNETVSPEQIEEPSHQTGTNGDPAPGTSNGYPHMIPPHETPQPPAYYGAYNNSQVTPESPSPNNNNEYVTNNNESSSSSPTTKTNVKVSSRKLSFNTKSSFSMFDIELLVRMYLSTYFKKL